MVAITIKDGSSRRPLFTKDIFKNILFFLARKSEEFRDQKQV